MEREGGGCVGNSREKRVKNNNHSKKSDSKRQKKKKSLLKLERVFGSPSKELPIVENSKPTI